MGVAILGYVSFGAGGAAGGVGILISLALLLTALLRARKDPVQAALVDRIATRTLVMLPGAALVYLSYDAGGFFPGPTSLVAVLFALILAARLVLGAGTGGHGRALPAIGIAFAAYTAWVLLSGSWSHAYDRALSEADLALVYGLGFVLFATAVSGERDMRWVMRGLALGSSVVCLGAFLSRAQPRLWPIASSLETLRVSYPLTYWNALGLLAALGLLLCIGLTSDDREPRLLKALSALPVPLLAVTLLLTFSRGAIAAGIAGLIAYVLLSRARSLVSAVLALVPSTAVSLIVAYRATSLTDALDGGSLQSRQGHHLALVVVACALAAALARWLLAGLDPRLLRFSERHPVSPATARRSWAAGIALVVLGSLALGLPGAVSKQYDRFVQGNHPAVTATLRDRLTDPGAHYRLDLWRAALHAFDGAPVAGTGAGTFAVVWAAHHSPPLPQAVDAHSIYLENLGELGVVGLGLLLCIVLGSLAAIGRRMRGSERTLYAAAFGAALAWALGAGVDWDWEMPAVTLPIFVLAGAALGRSKPTTGARRRPLLGLLVLVAAIAPALLNVSQNHLDASLTAFTGSDCANASSQARSSLEPLSFRPPAHEILAYCHAARGERGRALAEITSAVRGDPLNWEPQYGLAIVQAAAGRDPRPAARAALLLNPAESVVADTEAQFRTDPPSSWTEDAASAPLPIGGGYTTTLGSISTGGG